MEKTNKDEINNLNLKNTEKISKDYKIIGNELRTKQLSGKGSKFGKYSEFIVGKKGIAAFLKYEFLTCTFSDWPGAFGIFLRSIFFRFLFKKVGKGVSFGKNITIRHPNKIVIGNNVVIDDNCVLDAKGTDNKGIMIKDGVFIGRNTILSCKDGNITLDENTNIGFNSELCSANDLNIGKNTLIAAYVYFVAGDHTYNITDKPVIEQIGRSQGINIGENCWFGVKSTVFDGVNIGNDVIIGASAVVNTDIPSFSIAVGIPAKVIKSRL
jgi:acetyltransferase-like isoleucine patch superfamily enzyme